MPIFVRLPLSRRTACIDCDADGAPLAELTQEVARLEGIPEKCLALTCGGRRLTGATVTTGQWLTCVVTGLSGGKGGFGSMLRAIGAQIEKTTNREACRDLSGRRLRDINHETRLKRWVAKQAEREGQREQRKTPREPQHQLQDPEYERLREQIPERIQEAVTQGRRVKVCPRAAFALCELYGTVMQGLLPAPRSDLRPPAMAKAVPGKGQLLPCGYLNCPAGNPPLMRIPSLLTKVKARNRQATPAQAAKKTHRTWNPPPQWSRLLLQREKKEEEKKHSNRTETNKACLLLFSSISLISTTVLCTPGKREAERG
ncbi:hypothetical protein HPB48_020463 [Haemaphysalis longicornis]|uniref:SDE2-like domain-containing protein n=1 Tax=Haemaphysalis longicornis TaxID=44386 RepID=A0A9J6FN85_HAELO|nr:hypothetical protein HPB48_020463 [Haemaphysalis longicornis]